MNGGDGPEEQPVVRHREKDAGRREDRADERTERREHHHDRHRADADPAQHRVRGVGGHQWRPGHLAERQQIEIRGVDEQVDRDDPSGPYDQRPRQVPLRVPHLAAHEREIAPAVVRPQHRDQRQAEQAGRDRSRRGRKMRPVALPHEKRQEDEHHQRAVLGAGGEIQDERAPAHAVVIQGRRDRDGRRGDVVHQSRILEERRVPADRAQQVLGKRRGNRAERRGPDQHQLGPPEEERRQPAETLADVHVHPARARKHRRELRVRERAAQREQPAQNPDQEHERRLGHAAGDHRRCAKDAAADGRAHQHRDGTPQPEPARQAVAPAIDRLGSGRLGHERQL